jgi:hypothetical protein
MTKGEDSINPTTNMINERGLTKREYFAAMAMQALITNPPSVTKEERSKNAVLYADALIKALNA